MSVEMVPPQIILVVGAILVGILPQALRRVVLVLFPLLGLVILWLLPDGTLFSFPFLGYELVMCQVDSLSRIFSAIFALITFIGGVYSFHNDNRGEQAATLLYSASSIGVSFAGDYITLLVWWEIMAVSSTVLVWARRSQESRSAGFRYLLVHLAGGVFLMSGIAYQIVESKSVVIITMLEHYTPASLLILIGVGLNAAIPPLHAWLADAYPKASITGAVIMSALTTKSAVYLLARLFPGWEILTIFGTVMTLYGVLYAVLSNDIREILAYHIISQVGYMVAGVGLGSTTGINGSTAHAFSHILYKALLFMGAGTVIYATGKSKLTDLGGLFGKLPLVFLMYMVGAVSISGLPLFNGFISKSIVVYSAAELERYGVMMWLNLASVGTFLSVGLKLPYFTWFHKSKEIECKPIPKSMYIGMSMAAILCLLFGVYPSLLYQHLPYSLSYEPYTGYHVVEALQLLFFTFLGFWLLKAKLEGEPTLSLDTDWFYRKYAASLCGRIVTAVSLFFDATDKFAQVLVGRLFSLSFYRNQLIEARLTTRSIIFILLFAFVALTVIGLLRLGGW